MADNSLLPDDKLTAADPQNLMTPDAPDPDQRRGWLPLWLLAVLIMLLLVGLFWLPTLLRERLAFGPTPTITPTAGPSPTATLDFRATRNSEDLATQQAYRIAEQAFVVAATLTASVPQPDDETPIPTPTPAQTITISVPIVGGGESTPTPLPEEATPSPAITVQVNIPIVGGGANSPVPTPVPTQTSLTITDPPEGSPLPTVTPSFTPVPTATPTFTPQPVAQPTAVQLEAVLRRESPVRIGPGSLYTQTTILANNQAITLQGRDGTGEWVYLSSNQIVDGQPVEGWTFQANAQIQGNQWPDGTGEGLDPNSVNRLLTIPAQVPLAEPFFAPTPVPEADYPLFRRDPAAQASVARLPRTNLRRAWGENEGDAGLAISSPVVVVGPSVVVASEDQELYSFSREAGGQRFRQSIGQVVRDAPAISASVIYLVTVDGVVLAVQDQGNGAAQLWSRNLNVTPTSGVNLWERFLFVPGANDIFYALYQESGEIAWQVQVPGADIQYPAIGNTLLYVGNDDLIAIDMYAAIAETPSPSIVWQKPEINNVTAPPVYSAPGVDALAELYAADSSNRVWAMDANTGADLWQFQAGAQVSSMALNTSTLYAATDLDLYAINRDGGTERWRYSTAEPLAGGPIAGPNHLILVTRSGSVRILDGATGTLLSIFTIPASVAGAPAVSQNLIFIPATDGNVYALQGDF